MGHVIGLTQRRWDRYWLLAIAFATVVASICALCAQRWLVALLPFATVPAWFIGRFMVPKKNAFVRSLWHSPTDRAIAIWFSVAVAALGIYVVVKYLKNELHGPMEQQDIVVLAIIGAWVLIGLPIVSAMRVRYAEHPPSRDV